MNSEWRWRKPIPEVQMLGFGLLLGAGLVCAALGVCTAFGWFRLQGVQAIPGVNVPEGFERWHYFARLVGWQAIQSL